MSEALHKIGGSSATIPSETAMSTCKTPAKNHSEFFLDMDGRKP